MSRPTDNYIGAFSYRVWISGISDPFDGFSKVSALTSASEPVEFKHGLDPTVRKMPGRLSYDDVTLERVYTGIDAFSEWRRRVEAGVEDPRVVTIELRHANREVLRRVILTEAWPVDWHLPEMDAGTSSMAIEAFTLNFGSAMLD
ncbi:MAG: phage tail protein [Pseudomonadota bacterium]